MTAVAAKHTPLPAGGGTSKAARLMRALGDEAGSVWAALTPEEAHLIAGEMAHLPPDNPGSADRTLAAWLNDPTRGGTDRGGQIVAAGLDADAVAGRGSQPLWDQLDTVSPRRLAGFLAKESPQAAAIILSRISTAQAGAAVRALPEEHALAILHRMVALAPPTQRVLDAIEVGLRTFVQTAGGTGDGAQRVAEVFEAMGDGDGPRLLEAFKASGQTAADDVARLVVPFDAIAAFGPAGVQTLIAHTNHDTLALALKGAPEAVVTAIFTNMTQRTGALLREDMEALGAVPRRDVETARGAIVATIRELIRQGDIRRNESLDDEDLVE